MTKNFTSKNAKMLQLIINIDSKWLYVILYRMRYPVLRQETT